MSLLCNYNANNCVKHEVRTEICKWKVSEFAVEKKSANLCGTPIDSWIEPAEFHWIERIFLVQLVEFRLTPTFDVVNVKFSPAHSVLSSAFGAGNTAKHNFKQTNTHTGAMEWPRVIYSLRRNKAILKIQHTFMITATAPNAQWSIAARFSSIVLC